jgi:hypothetical protein
MVWPARETKSSKLSATLMNRRKLVSPDFTGNVVVSVQNHSVDILNAFLNSGPSESSNNLVLSFVTFGGALVEVAGLAVDSDGVGDIGRGAGAGGRADDVDGVHVPPLPCFRMATPVNTHLFFRHY